MLDTPTHNRPFSDKRDKVSMDGWIASLNTEVSNITNLNPRMEKIATPANMDVPQLVKVMMRVSLNVLESTGL